MKNLLLVILIVYVCSNGLAQNEETVNKNDADSITGNAKIWIGYENMYAFEGVKQGISWLNLCHGGGIGLTLSLSHYVDAEAVYSLFFSRTSATTFGSAIEAGLKFKLVNSHLAPYLGLAVSGISLNEDGKGGGQDGYSSIIFPFGVLYRVTDKLDIDFSSRFSLKIGDIDNIDFDRLLFRLGIIYDI